MASANEGSNVGDMNQLLSLLLGLNQRIRINQLSLVLSTPFEETKKGQPPASKAAINALPVLEIDAEKEDQCAVCLEEWKEKEKGVAMPCKHVFHKGCVEKWLNLHGSCPVCRFQLPVDDEENKTGDDGERLAETWVLTFRGTR